MRALEAFVVQGVAQSRRLSISEPLAGEHTKANPGDAGVKHVPERYDGYDHLGRAPHVCLLDASSPAHMSTTPVVLDYNIIQYTDA